MIYTGPIDEFFDFRFGKLPYRSLEFKHRDAGHRAVYQAAPVVNYPNDYAYTRITEFKYLTGQSIPKTSIVYEFPAAPKAILITRCRGRRTRSFTSNIKRSPSYAGRAFRGPAGDLQVLQHGPGHRAVAFSVCQDFWNAPARLYSFHHAAAAHGNSSKLRHGHGRRRAGRRACLLNCGPALNARSTG